VGNVKVEGGHITAATPTESHHVATKGYVDDSWVIEVYREWEKTWEQVGYLERVEWLGGGEGETGKLREVIYDREGNSWQLGGDGFVYKNGEKYAVLGEILEWQYPQLGPGNYICCNSEEARDACAYCKGGELVGYECFEIKQHWSGYADCSCVFAQGECHTTASCTKWPNVTFGISKLLCRGVPKYFVGLRWRRLAGL
jgi:hypothetical protein